MIRKSIISRSLRSRFASQHGCWLRQLLLSADMNQQADYWFAVDVKTWGNLITSCLCLPALPLLCLTPHPSRLVTDLAFLHSNTFWCDWNFPALPHHQVIAKTPRIFVNKHFFFLSASSFALEHPKQIQFHARHKNISLFSRQIAANRLDFFLFRRNFLALHTFSLIVRCQQSKKVC